jgi:hypothetical protein
MHACRTRHSTTGADSATAAAVLLACCCRAAAVLLHGPHCVLAGWASGWLAWWCWAVSRRSTGGRGRLHEDPTSRGHRPVGSRPQPVPGGRVSGCLPAAGAGLERRLRPSSFCSRPGPLLSAWAQDRLCAVLPLSTPAPVPPARGLWWRPGVVACRRLSGLRGLLSALSASWVGRCLSGPSPRSLVVGTVVFNGSSRTSCSLDWMPGGGPAGLGDGPGRSGWVRRWWADAGGYVFGHCPLLAGVFPGRQRHPRVRAGQSCRFSAPVVFVTGMMVFVGVRFVHGVDVARQWRPAGTAVDGAGIGGGLWVFPGCFPCSHSGVGGRARGLCGWHRGGAGGRFAKGPKGA